MNSRARLLVPALLAAAAVVAALVGVPVTPPAAQAAGEPKVVVISIDGLNPEAITRLGSDRAPAYHRLIRQGATTLNARSSVELTETLPNHTTMVTGRRITASAGGHGVTWNTDRSDPATVQLAAGEWVDSIFSVAHREGMTSGLYTAKKKLLLFDRSWPTPVTRAVLNTDNTALVDKVRSDLVNADLDLTFLHVSSPDVAGHEHGYMSSEYVEAVRKTDTMVGRILTTIANSDDLRSRTTVVLTSDHGGGGLRTHHSTETRLDNYRIPFMVWGAGVVKGTDIYDLSTGLRDPGTSRPAYGTTGQPVRNAYVANVAMELLGLPNVSSDSLGRDRALDWR